jgi:hypothetical protein
MEVSTSERRVARSGIAAPAVNPAADSWMHGNTVQLSDPTGMLHAAEQRPSAPQPRNVPAESRRPTLRP